MNTKAQEPPGGSTKLRLFVAIELPDSVRELIEGEMLRLKRHAATSLGPRSAEESLKWVAPEAVHLTLKFLGYVEPALVAPLEESLREATRAIPRFIIDTGGVGVFPSANKPRVIWIGLKGDLAPLNDLQSQVEAATSQLGFVAEKRPFSPHLTLARVRERASIGEMRLIGQVVKEFSNSPIESRPISVDRASLMRSELTRQGPLYTCLANFDLLPRSQPKG